MNYQVQELDGSPMSDHETFEAANLAAKQLAEDLQRPFRVVRTA